MADAEASEGCKAEATEQILKPPEDEQPVAMEEEQSKAEAEEKATENGHQTEDFAPEDEKKEETTEKTESLDEVVNNEPTKDKPNGEMQQKEQESEVGHGATVAKHYNEHKDNTREERKTSRIFYLRNFNNWVKSVLINEFMEKYKKKIYRNLAVLDLACGKGGDLLKWQKARISNLICADIADVSIKQCEQRYRDMRHGRNQRYPRYNQPQVFDAQFITADCSKEDISEKFNSRNQDIKFDMTSCQFALHYAFESHEQAEKMLQNACERLKPGGYFIGTIPCANEIINRLRHSDGMSIGNECYEITFTEKENLSLFGHKYNFHLEGVVDCPEFLVHFPLLQKMAEKFGLTLELAQGFHSFFGEHKEEYKNLLYKMNSLETYPPRREHEKAMSEKEDAYTQAKETLEADENMDGQRLHHVGTLSKDEWEAAGLYMVFAFKKAEQEPVRTPVEEDKAPVATEQAEDESVENVDDKNDDEKVEVDKSVQEDQDAGMEMSQGDEEGDKNVDGIDKKVESVDKKVESIDKEDEENDENEGEDDKKDEDDEKKDEDDEKKDEDDDKKDEDDDKKDEDGDKKDEDDDKIDEDDDKKDEDDDEKDEDDDKKDDLADKQDQEGDKKDKGANKKVDENADTEPEQGGEVGEQSMEQTEQANASKEETKPTTQRGGRRKRSASAPKEEASTPEGTLEVTPKRGTRKRKSTGGGEEEPPEKKKA